MPRSDEAKAFFLAVYRAVQEVPYGKVTSYGHIARLIGTRECQLNSDSSEHSQRTHRTDQLQTGGLAHEFSSTTAPGRCLPQTPTVGPGRALQPR